MPESFRRFPVLTVNTLYHLIHFVQSTYFANVIFMMDAIHETEEADFQEEQLISVKVACIWGSCFLLLFKFTHIVMSIWSVILFVSFLLSGMLWLTGVVLSVQIVCVGKRERGRVWLPLIVFFMDHYL
jgi:hypothetical protein